MRRVFIYTMLGVAVVLAACAPVEEGRRTNDGGQTPIVIATVPTAPTWTATPQPTATPTTPPTPTPTPTPTTLPTPTPTPTRELSAAEIRAASLPSLAHLTWRAEGNQVVLVDGSTIVATLDFKTGGLRWDSKKYFNVLNSYLTNDHLTLVRFLKNLKDQGVHFITFPDARENFPPYIVFTADGKDLRMVQGRKGTGDFVYDAATKRITGVFPDGSGYYHVNSDGSFDLAPLKKQAKEIAQKMRDNGIINFTDPAKADYIQRSVEQAIMINPYGTTAAEINDFIRQRTGQDLATHFNRTWGERVGVDYNRLMNETLAHSPQKVFGHLEEIGPSKGRWTFWTIDRYFSGGIIRLLDEDLDPNFYYPLPITLIKETYGSAAFFSLWRLATNRGPLYQNNYEISSRIGESISFAIQAYTVSQNPNISPHSNQMIDMFLASAFRGGPPGWVPGQ